MAEVTTAQVWAELGKQVFAVVGLVSARGEARTVGVVPVVRGGALWFLTAADSPKVRHTVANPEVSVTVPIPKRVPLLPWIKVPAATITFAGTATVHRPDDVPPDVVRALTRGLEIPSEPAMVGVRIVPHGDFVTYGVGTSLLGMRDTATARGRAPVATRA